MSKYKRSLMISTRTDIRLLAGLVLFYKGKGILARTKSSIIGDCVEDFTLILHNKELTKIPETNKEAIKILVNNNFTFTDKSGKIVQRGVMRILADEEIVINRDEAFINPNLAEKVAHEIG